MPLPGCMTGAPYIGYMPGTIGVLGMRLGWACGSAAVVAGRHMFIIGMGYAGWVGANDCCMW